MDEHSIEDLRDDLFVKIKALNETVWEHEAENPKLEHWLDNFSGEFGERSKERDHALYLLSHFMYFGVSEIKELLRSLYRDLFKYPIIKEIRKGNQDTLDNNFIESTFKKELENTRFLGLGNPSESGTHLLYYFRQVNELPKTLFIHGHEIFNRYGDEGKLELRSNSIKRYVFVDDLCSSGMQACDYSRELLENLKRLKSDVKTMYFPLFGLDKGLKKVRNTRFDSVEAVFTLDDSFETFSDRSRYFSNQEPLIDAEFARTMCKNYGKRICPNSPMGYNDNQLLLGFHHNIPDNTLPIISSEGNQQKPWAPIFKRYDKKYK